MILMSYRVKNGNTPPIYVRGGKGSRKIVGQVRSSIRAEPFPIAEEVLKNMQTFRNRDLFVYVAPGARVLPPLALLEGPYDVAAHVQLIGERPVAARAFSGVGQVRLETLAFRRSEATRRVLERWRDRLAARGGSPSVALAIALREVGEARLLHLPAEYCWIEPLHRPVNRTGVPVIEHRETQETQIAQDSPPAAKREEVIQVHKKRPPECVMMGYFSQYTGYAKAAREVLFRVANNLVVRLDDNHKEPISVSQDLQARLEAHKATLVGRKAPVLMIKGPDVVPGWQGHKVIWSMQESSVRVHPHMVKQVNENFSELWTPTNWNLEVFRNSGVRLPMSVMPLGVNPLIYRPMKRAPLPPCRLISTSKRGTIASPEGFVFLTVGLPGFRKGWDVLADAMEKAFSGKRGVNLVIAITHSPKHWNEKVYKQFSGYKIPIWTLEGSFNEHELAEIYSSVDCYASASRGEGFGLPPAEAAACGIPVIVPENTCHPEIFGPHAFFFPGEGERLYPEGDSISEWYKGQLFTNFGKKSIAALAELLLHVKSGKGDVRSRAVALRQQIIWKYTWDRVTESVIRRLLEVQP